MTYEEFDRIMEGYVSLGEQLGCRVPRIAIGLTIMQKYLPTCDIESAEHDEVWACQAQELVAAGVTEKDAEQLRKYGWFIDEDALSHFA